MNAQQAAEDWKRYGWVVCPATARGTCADHRCRMGAACRELRALGLTGDRRPIPRAERPRCGARTRAGAPCQCRIVPGKRRCRMHGGLSTGPRTEDGKARISAAQRRRWATRA